MSKPSLTDTIAAIATPLGKGGIGIVRLSGPLSAQIALKLFKPARKDSSLASHRFCFGKILHPRDGSFIDEAMVAFMRGPRTYTREDCLEIQVHGGSLVLQEVLDAVLSLGARLAQPGEFTLRAFLNGRIDLPQAEAVLDLVEAKSGSALRVAREQLQGALSGAITDWQAIIQEALCLAEAAIEFPEEDIPEAEPEGILRLIQAVQEDLRKALESYSKARLYKEGAVILILGPVNVGKSSLLNKLVGFERAIVTEIPGTTRDLVEELLEWKGLPIKLVDTAGMRPAQDPVEALGQKLVEKKLESADLLVWVVDASSPVPPELGQCGDWAAMRPSVVAWNKIDLQERLKPQELPAPLLGLPLVRVSALRGWGLEELLDVIHRELVGQQELPERVIASTRHCVLLEQCLAHLKEAVKLLSSPTHWLELVAEELKQALSATDELLGRESDQEILRAVFSRFCIGK